MFDIVLVNIVKWSDRLVFYLLKVDKYDISFWGLIDN